MSITIKYDQLFELRVFNVKLLQNFFALQEAYHCKRHLGQHLEKIYQQLYSDNILDKLGFNYNEIMYYINEFTILHFHYIKHNHLCNIKYYETRKKLTFIGIPQLFNSINKLITKGITSNVTLENNQNTKIDTCSICLEDSVLLRPVYCGNAHYYCKFCIKQLCIENKCPYCRSEMFSEIILEFKWT